LTQTKNKNAFLTNESLYPGGGALIGVSIASK